RRGGFSPPWSAIEALGRGMPAPTILVAFIFQRPSTHRRRVRLFASRERRLISGVAHPAPGLFPQNPGRGTLLFPQLLREMDLCILSLRSRRQNTAWGGAQRNPRNMA